MTRGAWARLQRHALRYTGTTKRAVVWAVVAAVVTSVAWYAVVAFTKSQTLYFGLGMGAIIGYATSIGAHSRGTKLAVIAGVVGLVAVVLCLYYINRFTFIRNEANQGRALELPLLPSPQWFRFVLAEGFKSVVYQYLYLAGCPLLAAFLAWRGTEAALAAQRAGKAAGAAGRQPS